MTDKLKTAAHPGRTAAQRRVLNAIGTGNLSPLMANATREALLRDGLIVELPSRDEQFSGALRMTVRQFDMPIAVHMAWCSAMEAECEE